MFVDKYIHMKCVCVCDKNIYKLPFFLSLKQILQDDLV